MVFNQNNRFDDPAHETLMGIWFSGVKLKQQARRFFKDYAVNESQFNVMMSLKYAEKPLSQQDLSDRLLVDKSNLTGLIDSLEKFKFVKRRSVPGDRRFYRLELTDAGNAFLTTVEPAYRQTVHTAMSVFTADEIQLLTDYMARLQKKLEETS